MGKKVTNEKLLEMLLVHGGATGAAAALNISRNTVFKRLQDPLFRAQYDRLQGTIIATTTAALADCLGDAVNALRAVLSDPEASTGLKIQAADSLLRHSLRYAEMANFESRIAALEAVGDSNHEISTINQTDST